MSKHVGMSRPDRFDIRVEFITSYQGKEYWSAWDAERVDYAIDTGPSASVTSNTKWGAVRALIDELEEADDLG